MCTNHERLKNYSFNISLENINALRGKMTIKRKRCLKETKKQKLASNDYRSAKTTYAHSINLYTARTCKYVPRLKK